MTTDKYIEALKLALEALEDISSHYMSLPKKGCMALAAIEEALAEQETVLPGGGHVPAVPVAVYGYCPECGGAGVMRERRPNGDDKCTNGHKYPSSKALAEQPAQPKGCQCPACKVTPHASDCAVHNEPAYQKGSCDCGAQQWNAGVPSLYPEPEPGVSIKATYEQPAQQEPVAWGMPSAGGGFVVDCITPEEHDRVEGGYTIPLYTSPPNVPVARASKPLSVEQIAELDCNDHYKFARAIEAAHGITGETQ